VSAPTAQILAVIADPFDSDCMVWLNSLAAAPVHYCLALAADIQAYLSKHEESVHAVQSLVQDSAPAAPSAIRGAPKCSALPHSAQRRARQSSSSTRPSMTPCARRPATCILSPPPSGITIKYRLDGVLDTVAQISGVALAEQVVSRLKVLAELDIGERRTPQDGSFRVHVAGRDIDLRVSIMPSIHGEDAVVRILDKRGVIEAHGSLTLDLLGFDAAFAESAAAAGRRTLRDAPGDRPDRLGEDHHPVRRDFRDQQRPRQDHHH
jgi:general secretion pathway protein E